MQRWVCWWEFYCDVPGLKQKDLIETREVDFVVFCFVFLVLVAFIFVVVVLKSKQYLTNA